MTRDQQTNAGILRVETHKAAERFASMVLESVQILPSGTPVEPYVNPQSWCGLLFVLRGE